MSLLQNILYRKTNMQTVTETKQKMEPYILDNERELDRKLKTMLRNRKRCLQICYGNKLISG